ncbi:two component system sensor histidine kinase, hybrid [Desulfosarcina variabilis str. Montpellier]|uniref:ATP-binding protein n=1 Tax=Desulfosarcina variabilis TaxID=2300 RepID=UPI003AFA4CCE
MACKGLDHIGKTESTQTTGGPYRLLYEQSTDAIFIVDKSTGRCVDANTAAHTLTGYPPAALNRLPLMKIIQMDAQQWLHAARRSTSMADLGEVECLRSDGSKRSAGLSLLPLDDETVFAIVRDITRQKHDDAKLKTGEQRFRQLFDNMGAAVAICYSLDNGESFLFRDANHACLSYIQGSKDAVIGRDIQDLFPGIKTMGLLDVFKRVWASGTPERVSGRKYADQRTEAWVESYVCKLPSGELAVICEDITAKRQSQEDQARLEKQIQEAQKLESIGVFAGGIAHDFNNILFPITGMAELLMEDLPEGSLEHESASEIHQAAKRAGDLVKQILSFSCRAEHKKIATHIQQMLKEIDKLVRSTIPSTIDIVYEIEKDCGPVMADPTQLHQIAMNLITNAYHAMETTGGRITVGLKQITLDEAEKSDVALPPGQYARFSVADTGCGIDPAVMDNIFEPYFTTKAHGKGTGLGLSVVYGIVKDHQGDVRVTSCLGQGTTMDIFFPILDGASLDETDQPFGNDSRGASGTR